MHALDLAELYQRVRRSTVALAAPLSVEDQMVQSMPNASPTKWHLAHTTWFFETFLLVPHRPGYRRVFPEADRLFNSYYESVGRPRDRAQRGTLSRPGAEQIAHFRRVVDEEIVRLLADLGGGSSAAAERIVQLVILGINHEEQHQELILTDVKHAFGQSPLHPAYETKAAAAVPSAAAGPLGWTSFEGGVALIGHAAERGFSFDNEQPRHRVLVEGFALANRLVTCGEYLAFMRDGGYQRPELWLSDGWQAARLGDWQAPLYWHCPGAPADSPAAPETQETNHGYWHLTLRGKQPVRMDEPVVHVSYYEADAFARWAGARLPRESEWERAAAGPGGGAQEASSLPELPGSANLLESGHLHPAPAPSTPGLTQLLGDVWEWTQSPYVEYPGYRRPAGALGEYNGKFMCNQLILRGGSCVTPRRHLRATYRNFFPPDARWQFSGIRLAKDA
jgi:ergothioneine biosynthesis protein EgtB